MTRRRILLASAALALCAGGVAPAVAATDATDTKRVCVALSGDPDKQEYAPICVWVPLAEANPAAE